MEKLKDITNQSTRVPLADISNQNQNQRVSPLQEVLSIPQRMHQKAKTIQGTATLPKHLSGAEVITFLEERKSKQEMEEKQKKECRQKQEERKKEREEEQKEKEKRREQRAEERAKRKEIEERKKEQKRQREETRKQKQAKQRKIY